LRFLKEGFFMPSDVDPPRHVVATVQEVLPLLGLAYVKDGDERCWGITRSMPGAALETLSEGAQVRLTIEKHADFEVASGWTPLG
jgi:hypothetical protein